NQQTFKIEQPNIFITVASENDRSCLLTEHSLSFGSKREPIYRRLSDRITEYINRVSVLIQTLDNAHRSAIDCRAEESRDRRIPRIFNRQAKRRELTLAIASKTRIEILETQALGALAGS